MIIATSTALSPSPTVSGFANGRAINECRGPASQLGNTTRLRGTSTEGPAAATITIASVATISAAIAIFPAIGPNVTRGSRSDRRSPNVLGAGSATVLSVCPPAAPATGVEANVAGPSA